MPKSVIPHCLSPVKSPAPLKLRSSSASSKPFLAVFRASSLLIVFSVFALAKR